LRAAIPPVERNQTSHREGTVLLGRTCADPRVLRRRRRLLWITVAAIALLLLFPYYITWFVYEQVMNNVRLLAFLWLAGSALAAEPRTVSRSASNT